MKTLPEAIQIINESSYCAMSIGAAERCVKKYITTDINEFQFSALVSLCSSIGGKAFLKSPVLKSTNKRQFLIAASQFDEYTEGENQEGEKHLKRRRKKEKRMFTTLILLANNGKTRGITE